ncbi:hypothetical protein [Streptomyces sp. NPDC047079]|uniref:hypothetical protein n=1 Tax=Streptomyces sp. NPDC047079 TaxID=3154607 RepID=UPI0033D7B432
MKHVSLRGSAFAASLALGLAAAPTAAHAQTFVTCGDTAGLITAINAFNNPTGGTIRLAEDCTYAYGTATNGNALPPITGKITIVGDDTRIVRSNTGTLYRLFEVAQGGNLTLRGIQVSAGHSDTDGGGIANEGTLTLVNSAVTGNSANEDGGGISNEGGTITLRDSRIAGNTAVAGAADGGGISNNAEGTLTLERSEVEGNTSDQDGGGIANQGSLRVENSTFSHNTARDDDGGAIDNSGSGKVTLKEARFTANLAGLEGGAINNGEEASLTATGSVFVKNTSGRDAGAINNEGTANLTRTEVSDNSAGRDGGGINNEFTVDPEGNVAAHLKLYGSTVSENRAARNGGGINNQQGAVVELERSRVTKNRPDNCFPLNSIEGCRN